MNCKVDNILKRLPEGRAPCDALGMVTDNDNDNENDNDIDNDDNDDCDVDWDDVKEEDYSR